MPTFTMTSKWGVQLEGHKIDLENLTDKINGSISSPSSFFIAMVRDIHVLRTQMWDCAATASDVFQLGIGDINLLRGCLDVVDGCHAIKLGTVYAFREDGSFDMSRETKITLYARKRIEDRASPDEFRTLLARAGSNNKLRTAFSDLTPDTAWIDIYRCFESLREYYGGEHKLLRAFSGERRKIKLLSGTANSFRHVKTSNVIDSPMPRDEAIIYLKDLLLRAAEFCDVLPIVQQFQTGQQVQLMNYRVEKGQPASLNTLSLNQ